MAGATDLFDLCHEWLSTCVDAVATAPGGPLDYAFVSPGAPALDCEQLVVWAGGPSEADTLPLIPPLSPGHRTTVQGALHLINITCTVVRCVPTLDNNGRLPSVADVEAASQRTMGDLWAIWNFTRRRHGDGLLFTGLHDRELFMDPAYPLPLNGGLGGWQIPIRVQLDGYRPA